MGQLKAADALRNGAGKGAFLMAEEFAFEQAGGDGGTVELHEGLRPPCAERMDRPRQQFFPGPRLAVEQHGRIGRGHELELREHRRERGAVSDDPVEAVRGVDDFAEYWSFPTSSFSYVADLVPAAFLHARRHTFPPRPWEKCLPSDGGSTSAICHTAQDSTAQHVESAWQDEGTRSKHVHDRGDDEAIIAWAYDVLNGRNEVVQCRGDGGRCGERRRRHHSCFHRVDAGGHGLPPLSIFSRSLLTPTGVIGDTHTGTERADNESSPVALSASQYAVVAGAMVWERRRI